MLYIKGAVFSRLSRHPCFSACISGVKHRGDDGREK